MSPNGESIYFSVIYRETISRLNTLSRRVSEGKDVLAASEFCRWLQFSGIIPLLKANSNSEPPPLKVDGSFLEWKVEDLLQSCNQYFATGHVSGNLSAAYLQSLHEKIDLMAGYLGKLSVAPSVAFTPGIESKGVNETERQNSSHNLTESPISPPPARSAGGGVILIKGKTSHF